MNDRQQTEPERSAMRCSWCEAHIEVGDTVANDADGRMVCIRCATAHGVDGPREPMPDLYVGSVDAAARALGLEWPA